MERKDYEQGFADGYATATKEMQFVGKRFGRLVAIEGKIKGTHTEAAKHLFLCDCGIKKFLHKVDVTSGRVRSCGCLSKEIRTKHGLYNTPTWRSWSHMKQRCLNPKSSGYEHYGGRGITICEEWFDFLGFLKDMGERPSGTSLDRIDVNGNYCKENCRWATWKVQQNNRRPKQFNKSTICNQCGEDAVVMGLNNRGRHQRRCRNCYNQRAAIRRMKQAV